MNLCTTRCENPEYGYKCCGASSYYTLHGCHWACSFMNGPLPQNVTQCESSCDEVTEHGLSHETQRAACRESCNRMDELTVANSSKVSFAKLFQLDITLSRSLCDIQHLVLVSEYFVS